MSLDSSSILLTDPDVSLATKLCILQASTDDDSSASSDSQFGLKMSSIFVILLVSTLFTIFPLLSRSIKWIKMPLYVYLFAKHFGTGVIVSTAFVHLLDPAYLAIGARSCVGSRWIEFPWVPTLVMVSALMLFIVDIVSDVVVERVYGVKENHGHGASDDEVMRAVVRDEENREEEEVVETSDDEEKIMERGFREQISAFLVLEFGIIFHSVMIGLNLGAVTGDEFKTLYIVIIFHQSFEGLGIGARLSGIPWPHDISYIWAYMLCLMYGLVTPISIAIGMGIRNHYDSNSYDVNIISGVLDSISSGILIYSGFIELLARDFIFNQEIKKDLRKLWFSIISILLGAGIMSAIGKWA